MKDQDQYNAGKPLSFLRNMSEKDWRQAQTNLLGLSTELSRDDLTQEKGEEEKFMDFLERKTGKSRNELIHIMMEGQREVPQEKG